MSMYYKSKIFEIFKNNDSNFKNYVEILEEYKKYNILETIKSELYNKIKEIYPILNDEILNEISELVQSKKLKFEFELIAKPEPYNYDDENEIKLQESIKNIKYLSNNNQKKEITWKTSREILGKNWRLLFYFLC